MTDDELTELEVVIDLYCREAVAKGRILAPKMTLSNYSRHCCPLGSVLFGNDRPSSEMIDGAAALLGIDGDMAHEIAYGFDGSSNFNSDHALFWNMGRRFRERLDAGEYR